MYPLIAAGLEPSSTHSDNDQLHRKLLLLVTMKTPTKVPSTGSADFEEALESICLRRGILGCSIAEINEGCNPVSEPRRSEVLLLEDLSKTGDRQLDSNPPVPPSSTMSYIWTPVKAAASAIGATASFVLQSPELVAKALLPNSEYDEDYNEEAVGEKKNEDFVKTTDIVVPQSLLAQSKNTIKIALDTIPPKILSASELRIALSPKLKDLLSATRFTWFQNLPLEHWKILIHHIGLDCASKDGSGENTPSLYIIGETHQPKEARIALHRLDANLASLETTVTEYEAKMHAERVKASRATTTKAKLHFMRIYKIYEKKLSEASASHVNLLSVRESVDGAANQKDTISALKAASDTLKSLRVDEDHANDVMDELQANMDEITLDAQLMNQSNQDYDEKELLAELDALSFSTTEDSTKTSSDEDRPSSLKPLPDISEADLKELDALMEEPATLQK